MDENNDLRSQLEEFVSPSDIPLFDLGVSAIDDLTTIVKIFSDRNSLESTSSFVLGIIKSVIAALTHRECDLEEIVKLIHEGKSTND